MPRDQEFLLYIINTIVENKDAIKVDRKVDDKGVLLVVKVSKDDMGRLVGKQGKTIESIRQLARVIGSQNPNTSEQKVGIILEEE